MSDEGFNFCSSILMDISEVRFTHLQDINLSGNNIGSIEGFNRIYMPEIKEVNLGTLA